MEGMMETPWLPDEVIDAWCFPKTQNAAKARMLRRAGLVVTIRGNGRPCVLKAAWEELHSLTAQADATANDASRPQPAARPNRERFKLIHGNRRA
jgi:hypothetical protein